MTHLFLAAALFVTSEPTSKTAADTANAARALLESARWVEVEDNHGDVEIRVIAAEMHYDRQLNTILVLGFPDEHKAIEQAIAQLRANRKK